MEGIMNKQGAGKVLRSRAVTVQLVLLSILFCVEVEAETTEQTHTYNQPKIFPVKVTQGVAVDGGQSDARCCCRWGLFLCHQ